MKVIETFEDKKNFYVVTEMFTGGELFDRITKEQFFSEREAANIMHQVLSAVNYCHKNNIIHRYAEQRELGILTRKRGEKISKK